MNRPVFRFQRRRFVDLRNRRQIDATDQSMKANDGPADVALDCAAILSNATLAAAGLGMRPETWQTTPHGPEDSPLPLGQRTTPGYNLACRHFSRQTDVA
jgi:hypothetical protein